MDEKKRHEKGMKMRRKVLGDAHVDQATASQNEFTAEFQDLLTRYAWGEIWTRPGLDKRTRSLLNIAMLVALNRSDELKLHLQAALNNGVSHIEIKEVLLQAAIYCECQRQTVRFMWQNKSLRGRDRKIPAVPANTGVAARSSVNQRTDGRDESGKQFSCKPNSSQRDCRLFRGP